MQLYTPRHLKRDEWDHLTPNVEKFEGVRPWLGTTVAPYLPLARYNEYDKDYFVMSLGKVAALASDGFVVPAGLKLDMEAAIAAGNVSAATHEYTATDVTEGVINSNGVACTAGEKVVASMLSTTSGVTGATGLGTRPVGAHNNTVSHPIGVLPYSYYRASGDGLTPAGHSAAHAVWNPTDLRFTNYQKQNRVTVLCDYVCEYAVVDSYDPPYAGIALFMGTSVKPGDFVTYDINSNLAIASSSEDWRLILGQVIRVNTVFPISYLDRVKTRYSGNEGPGFGVLDRMPGTSTGGLPDTMTYAGSTFGTVYVNLITR